MSKDDSTEADAREFAGQIQAQADFAGRMMALPDGRGTRPRPCPVGRSLTPDFRFNAHGVAGRARGR